MHKRLRQPIPLGRRMHDEMERGNIPRSGKMFAVRACWIWAIQFARMAENDLRV